MKEKLNINLAGIRDSIINFIIPIVCLALSAGLFFIIIYPTIKEMPVLNQKIIDTKTTQDALSQKLTNLTRVVDFKSVVEENSALVDRVLPSESKVPELLNQIDNIAKSSGLLVTRLSYTFGDGTGNNSQGTPGEAVSYDRVVVSLGADGTYQQMLAFFSNIEKAARVVDVSNFRFSLGSTTNEGLYSFNFSVSAPYLFVQSVAVTDDPVNLDIASEEFAKIINQLKELQYYDTTAVVTLPETVVEEAPVEDTVSDEGTTPTDQPTDGTTPAQ